MSPPVESEVTLRQDVAGLDLLADRLRLTRKQRSFAEALVADPQRNQTRAAVVAGAKPSRAPMTASRWARLGKVRHFIHALEAAGKARALTGTGTAEMTTLESTEAAVASLDETLRYLTLHLRARAGDYLTEAGTVDMNRVRAAPPGVITGLEFDGAGDPRLKLCDGQRAAGLLLKYHVESIAGDEGGVRERFRKAFGGDLSSIPPEVLHHLDRARAAMAKVVEGKRE